MRVVDELDDILIDYAIGSEPREFLGDSFCDINLICRSIPGPKSPYKRQNKTSAPASVAFITGLRRSLIDPESKDDPETHRYNNIYIEVALSPDQVLQKKVGAFHLAFFPNDFVCFSEENGPSARRRSSRLSKGTCHICE